MTRRSFLKTITAAVAALALPVAVRRAAEVRIENFRHAIDPNPPRYDFRNGEFHRVWSGHPGPINPAWVNAPYELQYHYHTLPSIFET